MPKKEKDKVKDQAGPSQASSSSKRKPLPVQLTWKGHVIKFPLVVLTQDLKIKADEALKKLQLQQQRRREEEEAGASTAPLKVVIKLNKTEKPACEAGTSRSESGAEYAIASVSEGQSPSQLQQDDYYCLKCDRHSTNHLVFSYHQKYHRRLAAKGRDGSLTGIFRRKDVPVTDFYVCDKCEDRKTFTNRKAYLKHLNCHLFRPQPIAKKRKVAEEWKSNIPYSETYTCDICSNRTFTARESYLGHVAYHRILQKKGVNRAILTKEEWAKQVSERKEKIDNMPESAVYTCEICGENKKFDNRQRYVSHLLYHERLKKLGISRPIRSRRGSGEIPYQDVYTCNICDNREFRQRQSFIVHVNYHKKIRETEGCDRKILTMEERKKNWNLKKAWEAEIPEQDVYECSICNNRQFHQRASYIVHLRYHRKIRETEGRDRPVMTPEERAALQKSNSKLGHIPTQATYTCIKCQNGRTYKSKASFYAHMLYHKKREAEGFSGPLERRGGNDSYDHIPVQEVYQCFRCSNSTTYADRAKFIAHLKNHDAYEKKKQRTGPLPRRRRKHCIPVQSIYRCKECIHVNKTFTDRKKYIAHMYYHSAGSGRKFGSVQGSSTKESGSNVDIPSATKKELSFACGGCGKRYFSGTELNDHQANNCKKVPCKYSCHCGYKFHSIEGLEKHVNKDHVPKPPTARMFKCYVCNSEFPHAAELDCHVQIHHPTDYQEFMEIQTKKVMDVLKNTNNETQPHGTANSTASHSAADDEDEDFPPIYPEVLLGDDTQIKQEVNVDAAGAEHVDSQHDPGVEDNAEGETGESEGGGWNFIPGLASMTDDQNESDNDEEFSMTTFEPEDVDVELPTSPHTSDAPSPTKRKEKPQQRRLSTESNEEWTPFGSVPDPAKQQKKSRNFTDFGQFKCGFCKKVCHRLAFLKSHFKKKHQNSPFTYETISIGRNTNTTPTVGQGTEIPSIPAAAFSASPSTSYLQQRPAVAVATVSPLSHQNAATSMTTVNLSVSASTTSTSYILQNALLPPSQAGAVCVCHTEEGMLGHLKQCTGQTCGCYTRQNGCSIQCICLSSCGNPFTRRRNSIPGTSCAGTSAMPSQDQNQGQNVGSTVAAPSLNKNLVQGVNNFDALFRGVIERQLDKQTLTTSQTQYAVSTDYSGKRVIIRVHGNAPVPPAAASTSRPEYHYTVKEVPSTAASFGPYQIRPSSPSTSTQNSAVYFRQSEAVRPLRLRAQIPPYPSQSTQAFSFYNQPQQRLIRPVAPVPSYHQSVAPVSSYQSVAPVSSYQSVAPVSSYQSVAPVSSYQPIAPNPSYQQQQQLQSQSVPPAENQSPSESFRGSGSIYRCFCGIDSFTLSSFLTHQWTHRAQSLFLCPVCRNEFSNVRNLILHCKYHTDVESVDLTFCIICDILLASSAERALHNSANHPSCDLCKKMCATAEDLYHHRATAHAVCRFCKQVFLNQIELSAHLTKAHLFEINPNPPRTLPAFPQGQGQWPGPGPIRTERRVIPLIEIDDENQASDERPGVGFSSFR